MFRTILAFALLCQSVNAQDPAPTDKPVVNTLKWFVVGNGYPGELNMQILEDNSIKGKIYNDPITGHYDPKTERFVFERHLHDTESKAIQKWEGKFTKANGDGANSEVIGTFVSLAGPVYGAADKQYDFSGKPIGPHKIVEGMSPPTSIVAQFVSGPYANSTACPTLGFRQNKKIAVFAKQLNPEVMKIAEKIEGIVTQDQSLARSFLFISHENDPTPSPTEFDKTVADLKSAFAEKGIQHLSAGVMIRIPKEKGPTRARTQVGIFDNDDVVVMAIQPDDKQHYGRITYLKFLKTNDITEPMVEQLSTDLRQAVTDKQ